MCPLIFDQAQGPAQNGLGRPSPTSLELAGSLLPVQDVLKKAKADPEVAKQLSWPRRLSMVRMGGWLGPTPALPPLLVQRPAIGAWRLQRLSVCRQGNRLRTLTQPFPRESCAPFPENL